MDLKNVSVENLVRSGVVLVVGVPVALSLSNLIGVTSRLAEQALADPTSKVSGALKAELVRPCLRYALSTDDSKLERESKNEIDEVMGGPVNYRETCNWVL